MTDGLSFPMVWGSHWDKDVASQVDDEAAATLLATIDQIYETRGLPVWGPEFALANGHGKRAEPATPEIGQEAVVHRCHADDASTLMQAVLPGPEARPHVARSAWFGAGR